MLHGDEHSTRDDIPLHSDKCFIFITRRQIFANKKAAACMRTQRQGIMSARLRSA